jgi:lipopolysaccharide biosynthesis regulator YciM
MVDEQMAVWKRTQALQESVVKELQAIEQKIAGLRTTLTGDEAADAKVKTALAKEEENKKELEKERDKLSQKASDDKKLIAEKVKEGYAYYERYAEAVAALKELQTKIETIKGTENGEIETYKKVKETTKWEWNKTFVLGELRELEAQKLFLAEHIIAKIAQAENRPAEAEAQIRDNIESTPTLPPESKYLYLETLVWQGKGKEALAFMEKELGAISGYAPHATAVKDFLLKYAAVGQYMGQVSDDYEKELQALAAKFSGIISEAGKNKQLAEESAAGLLDLYYQRLIRTFFYNQQNTYLLRNELGKFYQEEENLNAAIRQFEQVLAMDPNDMAAIYQLGLVYRWKGDWCSAMDHFKQVYDRDPLYERSAAFYNDLARQNSPILQYSFNYIIDTATIEMTGATTSRESELDFTYPLNTMFAFNAAYDIDYYTYYKEWAVDTDVKPFTYHYHDLKLGMSFYHLDWGLRVSPFAGLRLLLSDDFYLDARDQEFSSKPEAIFQGYYELEPYAYLEAGLWENGMFSALFRGGYERYHETYAYFLPNVFEIWGELNLILKLEFIDFPVIKGTKIRGYGKGEMLDDGNIIYETAGYLDMTFLDLDDPIDFDATLYAQVWYQDSTNDEYTPSEDSYYKPQNKFQIMGGLGFSLYLPVNQGQIFGISVKAQGGPYSEYSASTDEQYNLIKVEGDFTLEYVINTLRFYLASNYQGIYETDGLLKDVYYCQLSFKLGLEARFPSLIAQ